MLILLNASKHKIALCIGAAFAFANGKLQPPLPSECQDGNIFSFTWMCVCITLKRVASSQGLL